MTCTKCGTKMCYICKKQIKDYSHFDQTPAGQPATNNQRKIKRTRTTGKPRTENDIAACIDDWCYCPCILVCRLWDNTVERNANDVKEAAQRMMYALQTDKPDLAAQVRLDVS